MKDKLLRKLVPSVPVLARTPVAVLLDIADYFIKSRHPEYSHLPPASLRMRIGVGNKILRNHSNFIEMGKYYVNDLLKKQYLNPQSHVFEIGCGCGRLAMAFSKVLDQEGSYRGQDVDAKMINWCQKNLQNSRLHFDCADIFSQVYNPKGRPIADYKFAVENNSMSLVLATSVFSHLMYSDSLRYIKESGRILSSGGHFYATFFIMDYIKSRLGDRWSFSHKQKNCYVENLKYPEAAVAYDLEVIRQILTDEGFSIANIYNKNATQQIIVAKKE